MNSLNVIQPAGAGSHIRDARALLQSSSYATDQPQSAADYIDFSNIKILSKSGIYAGGAEEQKMLCLLSDHRLLIAAEHVLNPHVLSYRARLERMKHPFQVVLTSLETVNEANQVDISERRIRLQEHTMMQVTAKGLLSKACQERASDIHIRLREQSTEFYFRIHNDLVKVGGQSREYGERLLATLYGAMTAVSDNAYKPTERQDASIGDRDKLPSTLYGVRIATAPTSDGSVMVLRLLYNDAGDNSDVQPLGYTAAHAAQIQVLKEQPIGMNIISGPTGSGKSTTLQHVLAGEIRESEGKIHVLTIEDPIEYPIAGAVQTSVTNANTEEERSRLFSAAIANAMRLDPDTIMIGEVRDKASAQNSLRAAMTGHQVWTTLHANSAMAIIDRLLDLGLPLSMVADHSLVTGLISQRLVKVLCPHCKKKLAEHQREIPAGLLDRVKQAVGAAFDEVCLAGPGCTHCKKHGTVGRTVVAEVILPDPCFYDYVRAGEKLRAREYWLRELGGRTLLQHAIEKVASGTVDPRMAEKIVGHLKLESPLALVGAEHAA